MSCRSDVFLTSLVFASLFFWTSSSLCQEFRLGPCLADAKAFSEIHSCISASFEARTEVEGRDSKSYSGILILTPNRFRYASVSSKKTDEGYLLVESTWFDNQTLRINVRRNLNSQETRSLKDDKISVSLRSAKDEHRTRLPLFTFRITGEPESLIEKIRNNSADLSIESLDLNGVECRNIKFEDDTGAYEIAFADGHIPVRIKCEKTGKHKMRGMLLEEEDIVKLVKVYTYTSFDPNFLNFVTLTRGETTFADGSLSTRNTSRTWKVDRFSVGDFDVQGSHFVVPDGTKVRLVDRPSISAEFQEGKVVRNYDSAIVEAMDNIPRVEQSADMDRSFVPQIVAFSLIVLVVIALGVGKFL